MMTSAEAREGAGGKERVMAVESEMRRAVETAETIGWLEGFVGVVWLLPLDEVSDEMPEEYERRVARLRELVIGEVADSE